MAQTLTPGQAWQALREGNARFIAAQPRHPHQDAHIRGDLADGQAPFAVFFGCGDSRVAAEIIFDQGLGDLFVVRTAGHVIDPSVLGSIEFGVEILGAPLIVVLGHDSCGAIKATVNAIESGELPPGFMRDIVERVAPSVLTANRDSRPTVDDIEIEHVRSTVRLIADRSRLIGDRIARGELAIVGAQYRLADGEANLVASIGEI